MEIEEYLDSAGDSPFGDWFQSLDLQAGARITRILTRMGQGNLADTKSVGDGVIESRIDFGPGYRLYFGIAGDTLILLLAEVPNAASRPTSMPQKGVGRITRREGKISRMAGLTRIFKESVKIRVEREPAFREALLAEAVDSLVAGEVEVGKAMLRDFINATMGFEKLSADVGTPAKSLMRMLSAAGNPTATNLFAVIRQVQQSTGVHLGVAPTSSR